MLVTSVTSSQRVARARQARIEDAEKRKAQESRVERNRDQLIQDEAFYGLAFVDVNGNRVDPEKVFKSIVNTYTDWRGRSVKLWHSEVEGLI